ncbi:hypothetical protein DW322_00510 [Rhodococcus rhodnii]|uniref:Uncharacterized protein n=2 Tax=Rhodococcus rhodnii TaxID=38312 RepID=R7WRA8_9NOCA|nr:hypothetical protein [Rhodococcus rhodnii]EOM77810.1 hypothetical protein Rrhod_0796 [Rhodococcus rhodnii LMG 5362]TXG88995.1 hypothetical protein DW322_00510 [Rhodococcus rhodnii]
MPDGSIIDRYQAYRTRRFLENDEKYSTMLPKWRTLGRRRALVVTVGAGLTIYVLCGLAVALAGPVWALPILPVTLVFISAWTMLQIVSSRQGDAPRAALDEWEIARRNSARSIGLTVTQFAGLVPTFVLIVAATAESVSPDLAYACGVWMLAAVLLGGMLPAMLLAWNHPDPEDDVI